MTHDHKRILVALAGQPNCGKSTIFNMLTGARQHVANFPGVTVEKKQGSYRYGAHHVDIVDLPGTYSLTSYTQEERVSRDFILLEKPEVVVVVVDAANLERSLYLAFQVREMSIPMILCLNMMDVAKRRGFTFDLSTLEKRLGVPVVTTIGAKGIGRDTLKKAIDEMCSSAGHTLNHWQLDYGEILEPTLKDLGEELSTHEHLMENFNARWLAVKLMESDSEARRIVQHYSRDGGVALAEKADTIRQNFQELKKKSPEKIIATRRYLAASKIIADAVKRPKEKIRTLTDKIDAVVLHRVAAPFILAAVLLVFYQLTMIYGTKLADWCFPYIGQLKVYASNAFYTGDVLRSGLVQSLLADGVVGGVVAILYYVPIFTVLFALIAILEDTGYMARVAFIMDRVLRGFGLHGQSTLPMILGGVIVGGCAVPGVIATRAMKDQKARLVTILIMPLMNCLAKIPFFILIVGIFFAPQHASLALFGLSLFSFIVALLLAKIFSRFLVRGETAPFVMELPAYHLPTVGGVVRRMVERVWLFLKKVITVIAAVQIVVWFCVTFPGIGMQREIDFDRQLQEERIAAMDKAGQSNPYNFLWQGDTDYAYERFEQRFKRAKQDAGDDEAALAQVEEKFAAEKLDFFLVANAGKALDGSKDSQAKKAASAMKKYLRNARSLKLERKKAQVNTSYAGQLGRALQPISQYAGFRWRLNIAIISSFAAKESLVGTLGTLYSLEENDSGALETLREAIAVTETGLTIWHALAILAFVAMFPPCIATLIMVKTETNSRWVLFTSIYPIVIGYIIAVCIFQFGMHFG
ncbi:ferrous iron transport protein B [candidate division KSB3 bacterium]|uniref:Ferrous iron transport protein B n=1 Tax=candidate division KSB3 bacterium TaxID=2044937 RepID=A0A2G6E688_9BACT|nr:MAG: ferrous iron transport protein B [candidate division KSB3 bacterium]PIE29985.1 MAG: ferrous iron transport protein B [candidate division KSB3 bacterium]